MDELQLAMRVSALIDEQLDPQQGNKSMVEVSEITGTSWSAMLNWVNGTAHIPFVPMARLARLTDTSLDWLAHGDEFDRYVVSGECDLFGDEL
ncbi:MAG: helix-turn-helix transcriptional regulator [Rhodobacteraceae bacterium]|nr:helix-turn-helix transcriptional regulator [Paracoccaceae bacterium]